MGLTLLLLMPTGCPMGARGPTVPDPPAIETVMLMLLYTPCWPKACTAPCPGWLNKLWHGGNKAKDTGHSVGVLCDPNKAATAQIMYVYI